MAEPVGGGLELDRDKRAAGPVEPAPAAENVVDQGLADEQRQELVQDHPLVVPDGELAGALEQVGRGLAAIVREPAHDPVVEQQERGVEAGDHQVLVVARIGDDGGQRVGVARQVLEPPPVTNRELGRSVAAAPVEPHIELRCLVRPAAIDRIEIEGRRARVGRVARLRRPTQAGRQVEGQVMIHELTDERRPCRMRGVVRVVPAELQIDDELCRPRGQIVLGIQEAAGSTELQHDLVELAARFRKRPQPGEQPAEPVLPVGRTPPGGALPRQRPPAAPPPPRPCRPRPEALSDQFACRDRGK